METLKLYLRATMPEMSMKQAADWAGVSKPTISKALTSGRLSGTKDENGQWSINPAELGRVFPSASQRNANVSHSDTPDATAGNTREIALLREMLDEARREREDIRKDRDHWREQAETQTRLLTHQQSNPAPAPAEAGSVIVTPPPPAPAATPRPGFLARLKAVVVPSA